MVTGGRDAPCRRILFLGGCTFDLEEEGEDQIGRRRLVIVERGNKCPQRVVVSRGLPLMSEAVLWDGDEGDVVVRAGTEGEWFQKLDRAVVGRVGVWGAKGLDTLVVVACAHRWWKSPGEVEVHGIGGQFYLFVFRSWPEADSVVNKWFALQAMSDIPGNVENVRNLLNHPAFDLRNPNKVASRMVSAFSRWKRYDETRQSLAKAQLEMIMSANGLSENVFEIASKSLAA
ncbi:hypothetical protein TEA_007326 [Camellia sinensis var. sinensis]|uniref:Peptidase M1 alanyl aminopeptidase C-terminal domain-containing protein n=1 Tax=Camellia sinensis var. sinensis TaxID=542762 RepID=A0A4V6RYE8_CAMSN|nr:hypothetical protein TEA_007326 [Camellia sinensis var. sinensis]